MTTPDCWPSQKREGTAFSDWSYVPVGWVVCKGPNGVKNANFNRVVCCCKRKTTTNRYALHRQDSKQDDVLPARRQSLNAAFATHLKYTVTQCAASTMNRCDLFVFLGVDDRKNFNRHIQTPAMGLESPVRDFNASHGVGFTVALLQKSSHPRNIVLRAL